MQKALTDALIKGLKPPANGRHEVVDLRCVGLCFRVTANGAKSWAFRFRDPTTSAPQRLTLGTYPEMPLALARKYADEARAKVAEGKNPIEERRQARTSAGSKSFKALADRYMREHSERHKKSTGEDQRNLDLHILSFRSSRHGKAWRAIPYDQIRRSDAIELLESIVAAGKPVLANRVQTLLSSIYSFAIDAELTEVNPVARLRKRGVETPSTRVLTDPEMRLFWPGIIQTPVSRKVGLALRLLLLTGVRPGEVAGADRREFEHLDNGKTARWIIPAERMKGSRTERPRPHLVPLTDAARGVVKEALALLPEDEQLLFPSPMRDGQAILTQAMSKAMERFAESLDSAAWKKTGGKSARLWIKHPEAVKTWMGDPPSPHDLRRTVATRLAELGVAKEDRDAVLSHAPVGVGKKHYDQYEREREKRAALELWAARLEEILNNRRSGSVVSLAKARTRARK